MPLAVVVLLTIALLALGQFLGWGTALTQLFLAAPADTVAAPADPPLVSDVTTEQLQQHRDELLLEISRLTEQLELYQQHADAVTFLPEELPAMELLQARVLLKDPNRVIPSFILGTGSKDGLRVGQPVMGRASVIGRISQVWPSRARVDLIQTPGVAFGALIQPSRALGVVHGDNDRIIVEYVAKSSAISSGDLVVTSGVPGLTPIGLPLGTVATVAEENEALTLTIQLEALENPWHLEIVQVVFATDAPLPDDALQETDSGAGRPTLGGPH